MIGGYGNTQTESVLCFLAGLLSHSVRRKAQERLEVDVRYPVLH